MKLDPQAFDRLAQADARFSRFDETFKAFLQQLSFFKEPLCPVKGIAIEIASDERGFSAKYRTTTIAFSLHFQLRDQGAASARVECMQVVPMMDKDRIRLGTFTFDQQGATNFESDSDGDPVDLEGKAPEIVLHFICQALRDGAC